MNINKAARPHVKGETRNLIGVALLRLIIIIIIKFIVEYTKAS